LDRAAKVKWGIQHDAMKPIYKGDILPLLLYGAPMWIEAMKFESNKRKCIRIQRLINIKIATAYRTSTEDLCIITGLTPIIIKTEEAVSLYNARKVKGYTTQEIDYAVDQKHWTHPAEGAIIVTGGNRDSKVLVYTDGSKGEQGVRAGTLIYTGNKKAIQIKSRLDSNCSNNQAELIAIINALEVIATLNTPENEPRTDSIHTDSKIALDSAELQEPRVPYRGNQE
jgi:hypothetical protein